MGIFLVLNLGTEIKLHFFLSISISFIEQIVLDYIE